MKVFSTFDVSFILLVLLASSILACKVKGEVCSEDLGPCDENCDPKCKSKHRDGKGSCDVSSGTPICKCFYQCTPPPHKTCTAGIGPCSAACSDECCNDNCAAKYPGAMEGHGMCTEIGSYRSCLCTYNC